MNVEDLAPMWDAFVAEFDPWVKADAPLPVPVKLVDAAHAYCEAEGPPRSDTPIYPRLVSDLSRKYAKLLETRDSILVFSEMGTGNCTHFLRAMGL